MTTANAIAQAVVAMSETREEVVRRQTLTCSSGPRNPIIVALLLSIATTMTVSLRLKSSVMVMISVVPRDTLIAGFAVLAASVPVLVILVFDKLILMTQLLVQSLSQPVSCFDSCCSSFRYRFLYYCS